MGLTAPPVWPHMNRMLDFNGAARRARSFGLGMLVFVGACGSSSSGGDASLVEDAGVDDAALTCTTGMICNGACSDTLTDDLNCGSCGHACTKGSSCSDGVCLKIVTGTLPAEGQDRSAYTCSAVCAQSSGAPSCAKKCSIASNGTGTPVSTCSPPPQLALKAGGGKKAIVSQWCPTGDVCASGAPTLYGMDEYNSLLVTDACDQAPTSNLGISQCKRYAAFIECCCEMP